MFEEIINARWYLLLAQGNYDNNHKALEELKNKTKSLQDKLDTYGLKEEIATFPQAIEAAQTLMADLGINFHPGTRLTQNLVQKINSLSFVSSIPDLVKKLNERKDDIDALKKQGIPQLKSIDYKPLKECLDIYIKQCEELYKISTEGTEKKIAEATQSLETSKSAIQELNEYLKTLELRLTSIKDNFNDAMIDLQFYVDLELKNGERDINKALPNDWRDEEDFKDQYRKNLLNLEVSPQTKLTRYISFRKGNGSVKQGGKIEGKYRLFDKAGALLRTQFPSWSDTICLRVELLNIAKENNNVGQFQTALKAFIDKYGNVPEDAQKKEFRDAKPVLEYILNKIVSAPQSSSQNEAEVSQLVIQSAQKL